MTPARRIAFFGGSFNPVHRGHLHAARTALRTFRLDAVHFLPARCPPHKRPDELLPEQLRLELLHLATRREPRFVVDDFELRHPELRYTYDTLSALESEHPAARPLWFLIGGDSLRDLPKWHRSRELVKRFVIVTSLRDRTTSIDELLAPAARAFDPEDVARLRAHVLPGSPFEVSATEIRAGLDDATLRRVLPRAVRSRLEELAILRRREPDPHRRILDDDRS